jgi:hypothetical protein
MIHKIEFVYQENNVFIRMNGNYILRYDEYIQWVREECDRIINISHQRGY